MASVSSALLSGVPLASRLCLVLWQPLSGPWRDEKSSPGFLNCHKGEVGYYSYFLKSPVESPRESPFVRENFFVRESRQSLAATVSLPSLCPSLRRRRHSILYRDRSLGRPGQKKEKGQKAACNVMQLLSQLRWLGPHRRPWRRPCLWHFLWHFLWHSVASMPPFITALEASLPFVIRCWRCRFSEQSPTAIGRPTP